MNYIKFLFEKISFSTYKYQLSIIIAVVMLLSGCHSGNHCHIKKDDQEHVEGDGHEDKDKSHNDEILFTGQQAEAADLQVEEIVPATFNYIIKTSGQILSAQGDEATVAATSSGIVSFAAPSVSDGAAIRAGETIVTISAKNLPDGDPAAKARITYETALKEYRRAKELISEQIISAKEFEQITMYYEMAETAYKAQSSSITTSGVKVTSPVNGYIKSRLVNQGEYVSVGQAIAVVSQNRRLQLRAEVSENYFKSLKSISSANFQTSYDNVTYKLSDLNGRLLSFGKASGGQSFYIPVTFEFDNIGDIIPGSFVSVYLLSNAQDNVISIPVSALTEEQGLNFVYLQLDEEGYKKQEVNLGQSNGDRTRILSGLKPGDRVVTKGAYQIKLAAVSSLMPESHSH
jgi:RND family efflux transporter MFP subunit